MNTTSSQIDFQSRSQKREIMDQSHVTESRLHSALDELRYFNRYLGGLRTSLDAVRTLINPGDSHVSILDIGTGGGDVVAHLYDRLSSDGLEPEILGVDILSEAVTYARSHYGDRENLQFLTADFNDIGLTCRNRWDVVHSSLFLHHLPDDEIPGVLQMMGRMCRRGIVINDLQRHPFAYYGVKGLTSLLTDSEMIQNDGPLSVLRSFSEEELLSHVRDAGFRFPDIRWYWAFRWRVTITSG